MVDIGRTDKITNLWPTPPSRAIVKSGSKKKTLQDQQQNKKKQSNKEVKEDGLSNNIDEYV